MPQTKILKGYIFALCISLVMCMNLKDSFSQDSVGIAVNDGSRPIALNKVSGSVRGEGAESSNSTARLQATLSDWCVQRNKRGASKWCSSMMYVDHDIVVGRSRPTKCLEDMMPGVKARMCTLCDGLNCRKRRKVLSNIEKKLHADGEKMVACLRKTYMVQEQFRQKFKNWEAAFDSVLTRGAKHRVACIKEITDGTFGPGLCEYEINRMLPGFGELVMDIADHNHNKMITSGELRSFFSVAHVFSHMAAPVVQSGKTFKNMLKFPATSLKEWLEWDQSEPGSISALNA